MTYLLKYKPLAILFGALVIFAACKKDSDTIYEKPIVDPLTLSASKPGDTMIIRGTNFSEVAVENNVKFNGVDGTVASATVVSNTGGVIVIELKVVIPATATTGKVTVTVHGNTVEVGAIVIAPLTFYVIKGNFQNGAVYQLITMNPQDGSESLVATLGQTADSRINDVVYLPATNEIMGVNDDGNTLVKINVTTKQITTADLGGNANIKFGQLVVDRRNNLYAVKVNKTNPDHTLQSLVKFDPVTGIPTTIKTFELHDWEALIYVPASNDVVGVTNDGTRLFKFNLATSDTSSVSLPGSSNAEYRELIVDYRSNLYAYKGRYPGNGSDIGQLVKVNAATGQETLLYNLPTDGKFHDKIIYVPQRNEFIGTWNQYGLYRINATSFNMLPITLVTDYSRTYDYFTSN